MAKSPESLETIWKRAPLQRRVVPARLYWFWHSTQGSWKIPTNGKTREETIELVLNAFKLHTYDGMKQVDLTDLMNKTKHQGTVPSLPNDLNINPMQWLDICDMYFKQVDTEGNLIATYYIRSTGVYPLSVRYATFLGSINGLFPFGDGNYHTLREISALKEMVSRELNLEIKQAHWRLMPFHPKFE